MKANYMRYLDLRGQVMYIMNSFDAGFVSLINLACMHCVEVFEPFLSL